MADIDVAAVELTPEAAVASVVGPNRVWLSAVLILGCGLAGAACAGVISSSWEGLRAWACAGYGVAIGGLLSLLPRFLSLGVAGAALRRHPAGDDPSGAGWPLRLVASALRDTPSLRRTADDFRAAVNAFVPLARGLLSQRLWPACVAAFTAPVLGLVSAWVSWKFLLPEAVRLAKAQGREAKLATVVPAVSWEAVAWPMIITIGLSLLLMVAIVLADQLTRQLLQRWAATIGPLDADLPFVEARLAAIAVGSSALRGQRERRDSQAVGARPEPVQPPPPEKPQPQVSAEELQGLGEMFRNG